jgi:hypothetical protein
MLTPRLLAVSVLVAAASPATAAAVTSNAMEPIASSR